MPYFSIETNLPVGQESKQALLKKATVFIAVMLGKPESFVMVSITPESPLFFGGNDQPTAFVQLKSIGLPKDRCAEFSEKICGFLQQELKIPKERIFIDFIELDGKMFGWSGKTF
jgi:phenylpyruvate tautomerase